MQITYQKLKNLLKQYLTKFMHLEIGSRVIKTIIAVIISLYVAFYLNLEFWTTSAVIAILSVNETKLANRKAVKEKFIAFIVANTLACIIFKSLGFEFYSFTIFLILFIPITVKLQSDSGIAINFVIITHYFVLKDFSLKLFINECSLMLIGVGVAMVVNFYMPRYHKKLLNYQIQIELSFKELFLFLSVDKNILSCDEKIKHIDNALEQALILAKKESENSFDSFYYRYFTMRQRQIFLLKDILQICPNVNIEQKMWQPINNVFKILSITYDINNDCNKTLQEITKTYEIYRKSELPKTRNEFENRAFLFQILALIESLVKIKKAFYVNLQSK